MAQIRANKIITLCCLVSLTIKIIILTQLEGQLEAFSGYLGLWMSSGTVKQDVEITNGSRSV